MLTGIIDNGAFTFEDKYWKMAKTLCTIYTKHQS